MKAENYGSFAESIDHHLAVITLYCHDNEHQRFAHLVQGYDINIGVEKKAAATHNPFAGLKDMLKSK